MKYLPKGFTTMLENSQANTSTVAPQKSCEKRTKYWAKKVKQREVQMNKKTRDTCSCKSINGSAG